MIKYIGSKRRFVGVLGSMLEASGAETSADFFTGTTRVAQEFRRRGSRVTAIDIARYSEIFGQCYLEVSPADFAPGEIQAALTKLAALPGKRGYVTKTFCEQARFFTPENGQLIDAIRDAIESDYKGTKLYPVLLTSLILAADRVDSTVGVQMAYLKAYAPRAKKPLQLSVPALISGPKGRSLRLDAAEAARKIGRVDFAYLDPPYNQHSYYGNYHIWETLVAWDDPEAYGVAQKRVDVKEDENKSAFNSKRQIADALKAVVQAVDAPLMVLSFNNEGHLSLPELLEICKPRGYVQTIAFDYKRYVGAQIGVYNPDGVITGQVSHVRNLEYLIICGPDEDAVTNVTSAAILVSKDLFGSVAQET